MRRAGSTCRTSRLPREAAVRRCKWCSNRAQPLTRQTLVQWRHRSHTAPQLHSCNRHQHRPSFGACGCRSRRTSHGTSGGRSSRARLVFGISRFARVSSPIAAPRSLPPNFKDVSCGCVAIWGSRSPDPRTSRTFSNGTISPDKKSRNAKHYRQPADVFAQRSKRVSRDQRRRDRSIHDDAWDYRTSERNVSCCRAAIGHDASRDRAHRRAGQPFIVFPGRRPSWQGIQIHRREQREPIRLLRRAEHDGTCPVARERNI
jgi:hypothetical protein